METWVGYGFVHEGTKVFFIEPVDILPDECGYSLREEFGDNLLGPYFGTSYEKVIEQINKGHHPKRR